MLLFLIAIITIVLIILRKNSTKNDNKSKYTKKSEVPANPPPRYSNVTEPKEINIELASKDASEILS